MGANRGNRAPEYVPAERADGELDLGQLRHWQSHD
jgi:hypothetical protein